MAEPRHEAAEAHEGLDERVNRIDVFKSNERTKFIDLDSHNLKSNVFKMYVIDYIMPTARMITCAPLPVCLPNQQTPNE